MNSRPGVEGRVLKGAGIFLGGPLGSGKGKSGPSGMGLGLGGVRRHRYVVFCNYRKRRDTDFVVRTGLIRWEHWDLLDEKKIVVDYFFGWH